MDFVVPTKLEAGGFFEALSWENAGKYPADLILLDNRCTALQPKDLAAKPTWAQLPAVKANQVTPWDAVPRFSYAGSAPLLENLATAIRSAKRSADADADRRDPVAGGGVRVWTPPPATGCHRTAPHRPLRCSSARVSPISASPLRCASRRG